MRWKAPRRWSATADPWAGLGIGAVGVAALTSVRRPGDLPLAALPLLGAHRIVQAAVRHADGGRAPPPPPGRDRPPPAAPVGTARRAHRDPPRRPPTPACRRKS
ncbi:MULTISPECIES: DUF6629 family protein [unclassified Streptomyces]|uniref:DUF6629 family protein n=1 Tax=unclassified Streptomyces TaxID=2593676 RepID=UPI0037FB6F29